MFFIIFPAQTVGWQSYFTETCTELHIQICIQILYLLELVTRAWKKRFVSKILLIDSAVIFNSDKIIILLIVIQELTIIRSPNLWNLSTDCLLTKVIPQTAGWGGTKCVFFHTRNSKTWCQESYRRHSLPSSTLLIGDCLSLPASWPAAHIRTNICWRLWHSKLWRRCYISERDCTKALGYSRWEGVPCIQFPPHLRKIYAYLIKSCTAFR